MTARPDPSDFQRRRAKRDAERIAALLPQLNDEARACIDLVTSALRVATEYDVHVVTRLAAAEPVDLAAIREYCRLVIEARHRERS
jgi:hypothetical protein